MQSGGVRANALVPVPSEDGTTISPGLSRAEAASRLKSAGVAVGTSIGTSKAVKAPSSMARRQAASAETLWLTCSSSSKTSAPARRACSAASKSLVTTTTPIDALGRAERWPVSAGRASAPESPAAQRQENPSTAAWHFCGLLTGRIAKIKSSPPVRGQPPAPAPFFRAARA